LFIGYLLAQHSPQVKLVWLVVTLGLRFPGKTLFEYTEEILGKVPGKIVTFLYILWFLHTNALVISECGNFLLTYMMPDTPVIAFNIIIVAVAAYAVRNGLEVLSRFNQLFIPVTGLLVIDFLLSTKEMRLTKMLPLFDTSFTVVLKGSVMPASWIGVIVVFSLLVPYLNRPRDAYRVTTIAILISGFILITCVLEILLVFGPILAPTFFYSIFNAVRVVSIANFMERLETILLVTWVLGSIVTVGVFYYLAVLGSAQWLGLRDYRPMILPTGVILVALSMLIYEGLVYLTNFMTYVWPLYTLLVFELGVPLILLIIALVRRKGAKSN